MAKTSRPARRRKVRDQTLLLEIIASLGAGRVSESYIIDSDAPGERFHGICEGDGRVTINPALDIVDTVLHELLHRVRPHWTEIGVRRTTARLMHALTHDEIITIATLYESVKRSKRKKT